MNDDLSDFVTSTWTQQTVESIKSFDPHYPIGNCKFEPGKTYGPFFKASGGDIERFLEVNPKEKNFAGFKEPRTKAEAREWYKPLNTNPLSHLHKFYVEIPPNVSDAGGFIGKIAGGTEFQINFNYVAVKYIVNHTVKELSD